MGISHIRQVCNLVDATTILADHCVANVCELAILKDEEICRPTPVSACCHHCMQMGAEEQATMIAEAAANASSGGEVQARKTGVASADISNGAETKWIHGI